MAMEEGRVYARGQAAEELISKMGFKANKKAVETALERVPLLEGVKVKTSKETWKTPKVRGGGNRTKKRYKLRVTTADTENPLTGQPVRIRAISPKGKRKGVISRTGPGTNQIPGWFDDLDNVGFKVSRKGNARIGKD